MKNILILVSLALLSACGDDLSGLPDPDAKAPEIEPDSYSFSTAAEIEAVENLNIYSQVEAGETRHYFASVALFETSNLGDTLSIIPASTLELSWYNAEQGYQNSDTSALAFSVQDSGRSPSDDSEYKIYFTVKNDTDFDVEYQLTFTETP